MFADIWYYLVYLWLLGLKLMQSFFYIYNDANSGCMTHSTACKGLCVTSRQYGDIKVLSFSLHLLQSQIHVQEAENVN